MHLNELDTSRKVFSQAPRHVTPRVPDSALVGRDAGMGTILESQK